MGRQTFVALFLSLLVIIGYNYLISQKYPRTNQQARQSAGQTQPEQTSTVLAQKAQDLPLAPQQESAAASLKRVKQAKEIVVRSDLGKFVITTSGARIKSGQLKRFVAESFNPANLRSQIQDLKQQLANASAAKREFLQREQDKLEILLTRIEQEPEMAELVSLPATLEAAYSPTILFPDESKENLAFNTALYQSSNQGLVLNQEQPEGELKFTYTDARGRTVEKIYTFSNSNYGIRLDIKFKGWQQEDLPAEYFLLSCGPDVGMPQYQRGRRFHGYQGPVTYLLTGLQPSPDTGQMPQGWIKKEKYGRGENEMFIRREHSGRIAWTGLENKYFLFALIPAAPAESAIIEKNKFGEQKVALKIPWRGSGAYHFQLYLGPKKEARLKEVDVSLAKSIDYGFFSPIARLIYQLLVFLSRWTHNFGWAIVLLCLLTKIVFYPLTHRSFESMQKIQQQMKAIQPEMDALRVQLKDNPQKLNKEIMALYRKRGVNPLAGCQSGCLPLLLQMPVFFALYAVLYNSIELRGAPFLGWIQDLSAKDPYYILPILMGISMFVQQKLTGMGSAGSAQQDQAKMMAVLMPVFLTWIFASLPSGVVLYWLTFNIVTALQQLLIKKKQATLAAT